MAKQRTRLVIASTTRTQNSGLFDVLIPRYEKFSRYNVSADIIAVGTGKALRIAKNGGAEVLFVHDPFREEKFLAEGYGVNRRSVMHNDFVILGPTSDPARIEGWRVPLTPVSSLQKGQYGEPLFFPNSPEGKTL